MKAKTNSRIKRYIGYVSLGVSAALSVGVLACHCYVNINQPCPPSVYMPNHGGWCNLKEPNSTYPSVGPASLAQFGSTSYTAYNIKGCLYNCPDGTQQSAFAIGRVTGLPCRGTSDSSS